MKSLNSVQAIRLGCQAVIFLVLVVFYLPESQVVVLGTVERLSRGDVIYAVYPDTTSFYQATVVQPPRKAQGGSHFVTVNFVDDSDEHGVTHEKAVLLKHVMRPPIEYMVS